jgi:hypothetical protein
VIVKLCGEALEARQANVVEPLSEIGCRSLAVRTRVAQDSSQLREPSRGVVHRA